MAAHTLSLSLLDLFLICFPQRSVDVHAFAITDAFSPIRSGMLPFIISLAFYRMRQDSRKTENRVKPNQRL